MIHVPIILGLKIASVLYRNRETIAQGVRNLRVTPGANEVSDGVAKNAASSNPNHGSSESN